MAGQENQQYTVLYGRLSQEDERAGESNSIQHQRTLLEKYAKEKGFENTIFLADDGYSGTNFERPAWKRCSVTAQPNGRAMTSPVNGRCWSVGSAFL